MTTAISGPMSQQPLPSLDPESLSVRTLGVIFDSDSTLFSTTLPPWGSMRSGALFERPTPEPLTAGRGSGSLLATPHANASTGPGAQGRDGGLNLQTQVSLLPTPVAQPSGSSPGAHLARKPGRTVVTDLSILATSALLPTPTVNDTAEQAMIRRVLGERSSPDEATGCWLWTGWTNQAATPYGKFSVGDRKMYAHRAAYEMHCGPIPDGYEVDHLCQNTLCVNPDHLEAVTQEENRSRVMVRRTHCIWGHEFTEENTHWVRPGARACRTCRARQDRIYKARKRGASEEEIIQLLPTPVLNDMGAGKTPEQWDALTDKWRAKHGNGNGHGKSLEQEGLRLLPTPRAQNGEDRNNRVWARPLDQPQNLENALARDFGPYTAAIQRWEQVIGVPAPPPTIQVDGKTRLNPAFVEWMQGLPAGWVTGVEGVSRSAALKMLGNGVLPLQALLALSLLDGDAA